MCGSLLIVADRDRLVGMTDPWLPPETTRTVIRAAWPDLLRGLTAGRLVRDLLAEIGVERNAFYGHLAADPQARIEWDKAREASADHFYDEAIATAYNEGLDPAHCRTRIDTLKWAARIRSPRVYGDRSSVDVNVRTIDLTRIIQDANARLIASREAPILDLPSTEFKELL